MAIFEVFEGTEPSEASSSLFLWQVCVCVRAQTNGQIELQQMNKFYYRLNNTNYKLNQQNTLKDKAIDLINNKKKVIITATVLPVTKQASHFQQTHTHTLTHPRSSYGEWGEQVTNNSYPQ